MKKNFNSILNFVNFRSMFTAFSLTSAFLFLEYSGLAQQQSPCLPTENPQSLNCAYECFGLMLPEEIAQMPLATISVDFHFIRSNGQQFQCDNPNAPYYAPTVVQQILGLSNDYFTNPEPNQKSPAPVIALTDTRFRVTLFGNPSDPCDAIFLHDIAPSSYSNPGAMHIIVSDDSTPSNIGGMSGTTTINLYNIHHHVFQLGWQDVSVWGSTLNHELGHSFGLCHAFSAGNTCPDIDPAAECGGPTPGVTECDNGAPCPTPSPTGYPNDCGGNSCLYCHCTWGTGNNFMGYTSPRRGITRSQWGQMYGDMLEKMPSFVSFEYACDVIPPHLPLIIPANTIVDWNYLRIINQNIEVQTGATLIVRCEVRMGKELSINVHRGARLFVLGGTITSQSPDCLWQGVWVHGNDALEQPEVLMAQDETQMLNPNGSGVVWLNGAVMQNAITAISTRSPGFSNYGGLVMIYGSDFINNGRAVEFMKYKKKNKSYFTFVDVFKSGDPLWNVSKGVSIWGCHGIKFLQTHFDKIETYGIQGIDFSAEVEDCSFKEGVGLSYGFKTESTMPNVAEAETIIKNCQFEKLRYGVFANSTPNMIYPLTITEGCTFTEGLTQASMGVRIAGESRFDVIKYNLFNDHLFSVLSSSTGNLFNNIGCNYFEDFTQTGVNVANTNSNLKILGNQFTNPSGQEIRVSGTGQLGSISEAQGSSGKSAGNCFQNPISAIAALPNSAAFFRYYVHNLLENTVFCEKPTNNLSDGGTNNYANSEATLRFLPSDCNELAPYPQVNETTLYSARQTTAIKKAALLANPQSVQAFEEYHLAVQWQEFVLSTLVKGAYESGNLVHAEYLLLGENTNTARRWVVGMRTQRGNISGAQALLNSMVNENQDDSWFKEIMAINFAIAQSVSAVNYQLTAQQEVTLQNIANTSHSLMQGYACALLSFCKGYTCTDEGLLQELGFSIQEHEQQKKTTPEIGIRVYPNPNTGQWTLECPMLKGETLWVDLLNLSGKKVISRQFVNTGSIFVKEEGLPEGIYFLRLYHNGVSLYTTKLIVTR